MGFPHCGGGGGRNVALLESIELDSGLKTWLRAVMPHELTYYYVMTRFCHVALSESMLMTMYGFKKVLPRLSYTVSQCLRVCNYFFNKAGQM